MSWKALVATSLVSLAIGFAFGRGTSHTAQPDLGARNDIAPSPVILARAHSISPQLRASAAVSRIATLSSTDHVVISASAPARPDASAVISDTNSNLLALIHDAFPAGQILARSSRPDGGYGIRENADDGGTISQVFKADGTLTAESWKEGDGGLITRSYYDSGTIKGFSDKRADGSSTYIMLMQSGIFKSRSDWLPNGDIITTEYDDQGQVIERFRKTPDGKYFKD